MSELPQVGLFIDCPFGHVAPVQALLSTDLSAPRHGVNPTEMIGCQCMECKRVFVVEVYSFPQYGGPDYIFIGNLAMKYVYTSDGEWQGNELNFITKEIE